MSDNFKIGIVGKGFVGGAVSNGFNKNVEQIIVDPVHSDTTLEQLVEKGPTLTFVCVPTPPNEDGSINVDIVTDVLVELSMRDYKGVVVVKSTIIPDYLHQFKKEFDLKIVYNPEFLTEQNAEHDFKNPFFNLIGGDWDDCSYLESVYKDFSQCAYAPVFKTDVITASLVKYALNSFYATKVIYMNELHELHETSGAGTTWDEFIQILETDPRMGSSHLRVPGPDGQYGFGGNCFPKDTKALIHYAFTLGVRMGVLETAVNRNINIRKP